MDKIVVKHIPVSELPEKLRGGLKDSAVVTVTVEEELPLAPMDQKDRLLHLLGDARQYARGHPLGDDPVQRIRKLRDEWDD